jgi:hypothetical protein
MKLNQDFLTFTCQEQVRQKFKTMGQNPASLFSGGLAWPFNPLFLTVTWQMLQNR